MAILSLDQNGGAVEIRDLSKEFLSVGKIAKLQVSVLDYTLDTTCTEFKLGRDNLNLRRYAFYLSLILRFFKSFSSSSFQAD